MERCGYCEALLWAHCVELRHGEAFCELREEYLTRGLDPDQVFDRLEELAAPDQIAEAVELVQCRQAAGLPPVPPVDPPAPAGPGEAAAQRWLTGWRGQ